jgi:chaperonin cofactor prefoldin
MGIIILDATGGGMENGWNEEVRVLRQKVTNLSRNLETVESERNFYKDQEAKAQQEIVSLRREISALRKGGENG